VIATKTYRQALSASAAEKPQLAEKAENMARSARIDLIFARNLLFADEKLPNQELKVLNDQTSE
jgi:hypothetical protein